MKRNRTAEIVATCSILIILFGTEYLVLLVLKGGGALLAQAPRFLQTVAAIGVLTMAFLQLVKGLLPVRGRFQERVVKEWIQRGLRCRNEPSNYVQEGPVKPTIKERELMDMENVLKELRHLAVTNEKVDLFNLPIEQLCGQITAAADPLLDYPQDKKEQEERKDKMDDKQKTQEDEEGKLRSLVVCALGGTAGWQEAQNYDNQITLYLANRREESAKAEERFLAYRNRLAHHFQRNIDGLQIEVAQRWRRIVWVTALLLSTVMAGLGSVSLHSWEEKTFFTIVGGLSAGFIATVTRDIVAVIERLRR